MAEESNAVTEVVFCDSWEDFKARLHREYAEEILGRSPLFRGHARPEWSLASPWERRLEQWSAASRRLRSRANSAHLLAKVLSEFKDLAIGLPGVRVKDLVSDDDWWTLGRHYGLLTPLLDWTKSPYVAAFFAFTGFVEQLSPGATTTGRIDPKRLLSSDSKDPVAIWSFTVGRTSEEDEVPEEIELVNSRIDIGHRQRAQRGVFTLLKHDSHFCLEDYLISLQPKQRPLRKYLIPGREAAKAIMELRMMNITFATLFPDLDGAALQANFEMAIFALTTFSRLPSSAWVDIDAKQKEMRAESAYPRPAADTWARAQVRAEAPQRYATLCLR